MNRVVTHRGLGGEITDPVLDVPYLFQILKLLQILKLESLI
jgi:hypothetical protein